MVKRLGRAWFLLGGKRNALLTRYGTHFGKLVNVRLAIESVFPSRQVTGVYLG